MDHRGLELHELTDSLQRFVREALGPGETIRWLGQPGRGRPGFFLLIMVLHILGIALLGGLIALVFGTGALYSTPALIVLGVLLLSLLNVPWARKQWHYTAYVVTNQRALIVKQSIWFFPPVPMNRSHVTSYGPDQLASAELFLRPDDTGDLVFETRRQSSSEGGEHTQRIGFFYIPDAKAVRDMVMELTAGHGIAPPPEPVPAAEVSLADLQPAPYLIEPPRRVPFSVQWQLLGRHTLFMMYVGAFFAGISLVFILPPFFAADDGPRNGAYYFWRLFPFIHLIVGLGLLSAPIIAWQRRVAILRHGQLAPVHIVAFQDANTCGPWVIFDPETFAKTKWFTDATLASMFAEAAPGQIFFLKGFRLVTGAFLILVGIMGLLIGLTLVGLVWFGGNAAANTVEQKLQWTLYGLGIVALAGGAPYLMWRMTIQGMDPFMGKVNPDKSRMKPTANFRFVFSLPEGTKVEAIARVDLRTRLQEQRTDSADLAIYLPQNPKCVLLLDSFWPAIEIRDGHLVQ